MTKRACPFDTQIFRQFKVHVNNYENDSNALKDVHDRTLMKLAEGSRRLNSSSANLNGHSCQASLNNLIYPDSNKNFLQKYVTNYFSVDGKMINDNNNKIISSPEMVNRCFFCDQGTNATYQCVQCLEFYCNACSFVNYESFEDNRICISCS